MAGRPRDTSDEEIVWEIFRRSDPGFVSSEIGDFVDMSRQGVHNRLEELEEMGLVTSKQPGRDRIWWLTAEGEKMAEQFGNELNQGSQ